MMEGSSTAEYSAVREGGAGLLDLSSRGRILVSGSEAVMFLNGLITNDMKTLAMNSWMPAAFLNVQGRLLAVIRVLHRTEGFLIDTEAVTRATVLQLLERFTLAGDFHVTDVTESTSLLSLQGKDAARIIGAALGDDTANVPRQVVANANLKEGDAVTIIRATRTAEDGFDLFIDTTAREHLLPVLKDQGAQTISAEVSETLRIEAGIPRFGVDMDETTIVSEANLDESISFTKGCYLGQEIVIRIKHRGHVARRLTGAVLEAGSVVENGAKILATDGKEVGRITSSTFSPRLDRAIALGYVKYDYLAPGTRVKVTSVEGEVPAAVVELPFVRGSWYSE